MSPAREYATLLLVALLLGAAVAVLLSLNCHLKP